MHGISFDIAHLLAGSLVEALQPKAGERILDLGCGSGQLTSAIADAGAGGRHHRAGWRSG